MIKKQEDRVRDNVSVLEDIKHSKPICHVRWIRRLVLILFKVALFRVVCYKKYVTI